MASILFERGKSTSTQKAVKDGKITYKTDTSELYFDVGNKRQEINANDAKTVGGASLNTIKTGYQNYINEELSPITTKLDYTNIAYGTCATAADVATKEITLNSNVNHWKQEIGSMIAIKFDISNSASNVKIKVGNNDAYPIWYNNAEYTSTGTAYTGYANRLIAYMFNGTHWVWITSSYDSNTTYTNEKLGNGYGTCSTAESTTAKKATFSSYTLVKHGMVSIKFTYNVPANSTLNINSKGAKNIYYRGAKIIANIIKAGDIATFVYDGTQYQLIAIDRWQNDINTLTTDLSQLSNVVDTKAPKDSPTLTGTPTAPTAAAGTNTTQIATTAFVKTALDSKITGPSTSVDAHVAIFDGTNTKKIKDSGFTIASNVPANAKFTDTTYGLVTDTAAGLMSSDQKNKLDYIEANANKYVLPNAGIELGGVKSGGDVTISNGIITVNDDSHNHVIDNIDGLQDKFKAIDNAFDATVDGPSSSTTNNIAVFADSTGKTIKDSGFTINKSVPADAKFTDTVYSLPVANTNALGGVKAGGDVNIDATGIITVKDDSHNHTIANIDELQNKLNEKAPLDSPAFTGNPTAPTPAVTDNDTSIATTAFVQTAINQVLNASSAMTFKGKINQHEPDNDMNGIPYFTLPNRGDVGDTYIVSSGGRIGPNVCEIGDLAICIKSYTVLPPVTEHDNIEDIWTVVQTNINGAVTGPTSSINKNVAIFDGITGTLIKDSGLNIDAITSAINEIPALKEHVETYERSDYVYTAANQALTNKTYNGYTLKDAAGRGVDSTPTINSKNLVESGGLYTKFTEIENHFDEVETKTISTSANDDDVVVLSSSGGAYSVSYTASHASQGPTNGYTSGNTTTSITSSGTIKIPQIKVNKYGHVTEATDESVTITMPTGFTITPTLTDDNIIDLTGSAKTNGFNLDAKHAKKGPSSGYTSGNSTTSISGYGDSKTIKIPQITVDAYGHVTAAADESITITMPSAQTLPRTFSIKNTSVAASSWVSSTRNSMYPFQATVNISNLTENYIVTPKYNNMDLIKYIISPETLSNAGNITIYAKNKPTTAITIPEINCYQTN